MNNDITKPHKLFPSRVRLLRGRLFQSETSAPLAAISHHHFSAVLQSNAVSLYYHPAAEMKHKPPYVFAILQRGINVEVRAKGS